MTRPPSQTVTEVFLRYLKAEGCRVVFGVPGGLLHPFFAAVENDPDLRLVVTKHEGGAAFMADGYARLSGRLAVCAGTSGPGATNLLTGVAVAFTDGVPLLVVTGQAPSASLGKGAAQETPPEDIDAVAMFRPVTKYSTMVTDPQRLAHHLRRALRRALAGRPGPVHLNIPVDLWARPAYEDWFTPPTYRPATHAFDRAAVARAAEELLAAERPALLVGAGAGIAGATSHAVRLAELLPAVVATTPRGKGLVAEDHPLSLGVLGFAGHAAARELLLGGNIDVLLTIGASLNETTTFNWDERLRPQRTLIQLDIDADRVGRNYPVGVPLVGDAQTILVELIYHVHRALREGARPRACWSAHEGSARRPRRGAEQDHGGTPVHPRRWRADLAEVLPRDAVVFSDIGGHMLFNIHDLPVVGDQRFILNLGFGSMGHGTAAPIGAALAEPNRPIVAIVGDACFTMHGLEVLTAAEYGLPVIWLVENNQMHGITWHGSQSVGDGRPMRSIVYRCPLDIAALARAMGVASAVVERPGEMQQALRAALARSGPTVIEIKVDGTVAPPLGERARTIAGFTE